MPRSKLAALPLEKLQAEIQRRLKLLPKLVAQRDELDRQIAELQGETAAVAPVKAGKPGRKGGKTATGRRPKARNAISLTEALAAALKEKGPLSVGDAVDAVKAAGYKSNSRIFRTIVNQTLAKEKRFKKVSRGQYALAE